MEDDKNTSLKNQYEKLFNQTNNTIEWLYDNIYRLKEVCKKQTIKINTLIFISIINFLIAIIAINIAIK